jgi:hypothetical protein
MAIPRYQSYQVSRGVQLGNSVSRGINTEAWSSRLRVGVRLTTSPCRKKSVENLLREKILK